MTTTLRQTTENNDIYLDTSTGQLAIASGKQAYSYIILDAIRTCRNELQLDTEKGIPYFSTVFDSQTKIAIWKHYVERRILDFDFVVSISEFSYSVDSDNMLTYSITVETDDGTVSISSTDPQSTGGSSGGGSCCAGGALVQGGVFYLPVYIENGVQVYRSLTQYIDPDYPNDPVSTQLSDTLYIKNGVGEFVVKT